MFNELNVQIRDDKLINNNIKNNDDSLSNEIIKNEKTFSNYEHNKLFLKHNPNVYLTIENQPLFDWIYLLKYISSLLTLSIIVLVGYYLYIILKTSKIPFNLRKK